MLNRFESLLTHSLTVVFLIASGFVFGIFIAALYYIREYKMDLSFSDIGAMLAGLGTVGLFFVAIKTSSAWKKSIIETDLRNTLQEWHKNSLDLYKYLNDEVTYEYEGLYLFKLRNDADQAIERSEQEKQENKEYRTKWRDSRNDFLSKIKKNMRNREVLLMDNEAVLEVKLRGFNLEHRVPHIEPILKNLKSCFEGFEEIDVDKFKNNVADYYQQQRSFHREIITKLNS